MTPRRLQISRLLYWIVFVSLFALAAWQRFSLPLDPIADPDTWGYLGPGLQKLTGPSFGHQGRNFIYPVFLFSILRPFGDFRAITIAQHLLGLAAGAFLLATWRRLRIFVPASRLPSAVHDLLGLAVATVFLVAGDPFRGEMLLRPEGVCAFFLSLNLYFAIGFIGRTFVEPQTLSVGFGIGTALTAVVLASLKPSLVFVALLALIPVGIFFLRRNYFWQKIALASAALVGTVLLVLPEYVLSRDDDIARVFLPTTLFVVHADLIRDQMSDDIAGGTQLPYPRDWLRRIRDQLSREIARSAVVDVGHYPLLGFSPDYLISNESSTAAQLAREFNFDNPAICGFYRFYYWRTWRQRPLQMMHKVVRQMAIFYAPICPAYDRSKILSLTNGYQLGFTTLNQDSYAEVWKAYPPAVEFMRRTELLARQAPAIEQSRVLRRTLDFLAAAYLLLLAVTFILAVASLFLRDYRRSLGWPLALTLFVFSYNAAACLEVAIVNSLEVPRYSTMQMFFTLLAEFLAAWLVGESLFQKWTRPRPEVV